MDDYDQLFEHEYQDDLDALLELEEDCQKPSDDYPNKRKKSLDFASIGALHHGGNIDEHSNCQQLVPQGNDLDVSFVVPLDQSVNKSFEEQLLQLENTSSVIVDNQMTFNKNELVICNGSTSILNGMSAEGRKRLCPEELEESTNLGVSHKKTRRNEPLNINSVANDVDSASTLIPELSVDAVSRVRKSRVSRRIPQGDFMAVTGTDGRRLYMSVKSDSLIKHQVAQVSSDHKCLQLLGTPLAALKAQMELDQRINGLRRAVDIQRSQELRESEIGNENLDHHSLWVDRYAPHKYTELLSDESTNRNLLRWLKLWDFAVFGIQTKAVVTKSNEAKVKKKEPFGMSKPFQDQKGVEGNPEELLDKHNRPIFKVALVSGPPGLGKTTLAHIVARHAGYNVVEMNASDDRSADVFRERIEAATQMKSMLGADPRPNCLIIDEIDGAPQPAINVLLSVIKSADTSTSAARKKTGSNAAGVLQRPIICICNDLYVPALRQLRQCAYLVTFQPTSATSLASRLLEVAKIENIHTDLTALLGLCEKADNDIRSCLNTLQFVKAQRSELSLSNVQSMSLGQKDAHKTLFTVWQHIFSLPKARRKRYINPHDRDNSAEQARELKTIAEESNTTLSSRFAQTLQMVYAAGEDQKVHQGLFENYLEVKVKDPHLSLLQSAAEWFCFTDMLNDLIARTQNYTVYKYLPFLPVTIHLLFASNHPHRIIYPHTQFEVQTKSSKSDNLIGTLLADVSPTVRSCLNRNVIVMELLPLLVEVIQPTLRPVNTQLYNAREKSDLAHLVDVMLAYNLTYQQVRGTDGQYCYSLEPDIDHLVRFPDIKAQRMLSYGAKQLITREIELERLRRTEAIFASKYGKSAEVPIQPKSDADTTKKTITAADKTIVAPKAPETVPNHRRQMLQPKPLAITESKPTLDFFGRQIVKKQSSETCQEEQETLKAESTESDVWFRFKEGFTNAVRKTVRVKDFL